MRGCEMKRIIAAVALAGVVSAAKAEPINFRGIRLGIPLSEVAALTYHDNDNDAVTMRCYDFTATDPQDDDHVARAKQRFGAIGVALCRWQAKHERKAYVRVGNGSSNDVAFNVYQAPDGERRLYEIKIKIDSASAGSLLASLSDKFGEPSIERAEVQNRFGATFPSFTATWKRDGDTIVLTEHAGRIDSGRLHYFRDAYLADYDAKIKATIGPPKL